jgi:hypothetical protein
MTGRKNWSADEVLSAADLNGYLMDQVVTNWANSSARDAGILSPIEGQLCYLQDVNKFQQYNGSGWVGMNSEYAGGVKIWGGTATPTADSNASINLWFN